MTIQFLSEGDSMTSNWFSAPAPVTRRVRAYFAPVNRVTQTPVVFDPSEQGGFNLDEAPAPWISLGWIADFARRSASRSGALLTGIPAAPLEQVRETLQAQVSLQFLSWTKLTMALATGSQHMNVLAAMSGATAAADGAQAVPAVTPQSGSTSTVILLAPSDAAKFSAGAIIAVDADYSGQLGYVGSPVAGAYVRQALTLAEPLPGGAPAAGTKVQAVTGFVDREGGCFYQEWSALFVMQGSQGERIFFHYPRLQPMSVAEENVIPLNTKNVHGPSRVLLKGQFLAMPVTDPLDGERIVCYRSFLPAANALV